MPGPPFNWFCRGCNKTFLRSQLEVTLKKLQISLDNVPADQPDKLESFLKIESKILHSKPCAGLPEAGPCDGDDGQSRP